MLELAGPRFNCCDGVTRRSFLKAGFLGVGGLTLADFTRLRAEAGTPNSRTAVIFVELAGGPSHFETYDPKPEAPAEYRGPMQAVATNVPGIHLSESMAEQAKVMDKLAVIRSIHHDSGSHLTSSHLAQTGYYLRNRQNRENEMPCVGSITARLRHANAESIPPFVSIPRSMRYGRAAYLGKGYNPFVASGNPNSANFRVKNLSLAGGIKLARLEDRRALLASFDETRRVVDTHGTSDALDQFTRQAFDMVTGDRARKAFDIHREDPRTRDRYGRNRTGQSLLLARRLVEAGVAIVTVRAGGWDYHWDMVERLNRIAPGYDRGLAALVADLHERGLAKDVLVVAMGEFGRTPRVNDGRGKGTPGRDHWGSAMSVLMAGGGLRTGQVVGATNLKGEEPVDRPYRPESVLATVYRHLEIDPSLTFNDFAGRPRYILDRRAPVAELI